MFETCQNFTMKKQKSFRKVVLDSLMLTWNMFTGEKAACTCDSDQKMGSEKESQTFPQDAM